MTTPSSRWPHSPAQEDDAAQVSRPPQRIRRPDSVPRPVCLSAEARYPVSDRHGLPAHRHSMVRPRSRLHKMTLQQTSRCPAVPHTRPLRASTALPASGDPARLSNPRLHLSRTPSPTSPAQGWRTLHGSTTPRGHRQVVGNRASALGQRVGRAERRRSPAGGHGRRAWPRHSRRSLTRR